MDIIDLDSLASEIARKHLLENVSFRELGKMYYAAPSTIHRRLKKWLADRTDFIDTNFLRAPVFSSSGGAITSGFPLTITAPTIESNTTTYYTLNGADPRLPGGAISSTALVYTTNLPVITHLFLRARVKSPVSSDWSALREVSFDIGISDVVEVTVRGGPGTVEIGQGQTGRPGAEP